MNRWIFRGIATAGLATGAWLLTATAANADTPSGTGNAVADRAAATVRVNLGSPASNARERNTSARVTIALGARRPESGTPAPRSSGVRAAVGAQLYRQPARPTTTRATVRAQLNRQAGPTTTRATVRAQLDRQPTRPAAARATVSSRPQPAGGRSIAARVVLTGRPGPGTPAGGAGPAVAARSQLHVGNGGIGVRAAVLAAPRRLVGDSDQAPLAGGTLAARVLAGRPAIGGNDGLRVPGVRVRAASAVAAPVSATGVVCVTIGDAAPCRRGSTGTGTSPTANAGTALSVDGDATGIPSAVGTLGLELVIPPNGVVGIPTGTPGSATTAVGAGITVGAGPTVGTGATVGAGTTVGTGTTVGAGTTASTGTGTGSGVAVGAGAIIGGPASSATPGGATPGSGTSGSGTSGSGTSAPIGGPGGGSGAANGLEAAGSGNASGRPWRARNATLLDAMAPAALLSVRSAAVRVPALVASLTNTGGTFGRRLPVTGMAGSVVLGAGLALIGIGLLLMVLSRRRRV